MFYVNIEDRSNDPNTYLNLPVTDSKTIFGNKSNKRKGIKI